MTKVAEKIVQIRGLAKRFGKIEAVRSVDLDLRRGEIYGFLGRNGAGKTTTIRMLLGLIEPSAGEVELFGLPFSGNRGEILRRTGYFVEGASAYPNLSLRENLEIQRRLTASSVQALDEAIEMLGLGAIQGRKAGKLSQGNRQRLSLARALIHRPELLILDEPANGLDPAGIMEIRGLLRRLTAENGVTVFMSSHILAEVEQLADRVGIIHEGQLVEEFELARLHGATARLELSVDDPHRARAILGAELGLAAIEIRGPRELVVSDTVVSPSEVAKSLVAAGIGLQRLLPVEEGLEAHFMRLTGGEA